MSKEYYARVQNPQSNAEAALNQIVDDAVDGKVTYKQFDLVTTFDFILESSKNIKTQIKQSMADLAVMIGREDYTHDKVTDAMQDILIRVDSL